jgi:hypothetical protein
MAIHFIYISLKSQNKNIINFIVGRRKGRMFFEISFDSYWHLLLFSTKNKLIFKFINPKQLKQIRKKAKITYFCSKS